MPLITCPRCKETLTHGIKQCPSCGESLQNIKEPVPRNYRRAKLGGIVLFLPGFFLASPESARSATGGYWLGLLIMLGGIGLYGYGFSGKWRKGK